VLLACRECGQSASQWAGRCASCGAWGSIEERSHPAGSQRPGSAAVAVQSLHAGGGPEERVPTGWAGFDRVLGGGIVPASVLLLAGEPGIGKSTLLLHLVANLSAAGHACLLASGEESRRQVAARAARLGVDGAAISFVSGRDLGEVVDAARSSAPFLLAVDSIQTLRDPASSSAPGGPGQVRACADALVGLAKSEAITVVMTGHVTKDGDVAGPRTLEHAVDVVLTFDGDARSGLRQLASGKNRFGSEGEVTWFEMSARGLAEADPTAFLLSGSREQGSAPALPLAGRRALAVEIEALAVAGEGPPRRQATGIDLRRFSLMAAVLDRLGGVPVARMELFGATGGGIQVDDPGWDLAIVAAIAPAATGNPPPEATAFVGEVSLTGRVKAVPGMPQRLAAAVRAGMSTVFAAAAEDAPEGVRVVPVRHVADALGWAGRGVARERVSTP